MLLNIFYMNYIFLNSGKNVKNVPSKLKIVFFFVCFFIYCNCFECRWKALIEVYSF